LTQTTHFFGLYDKSQVSMSRGSSRLKSIYTKEITILSVQFRFSLVVPNLHRTGSNNLRKQED